jgi:hypothetical protein
MEHGLAGDMECQPLRRGGIYLTAWHASARNHLWACSSAGGPMRWPRYVV